MKRQTTDGGLGPRRGGASATKAEPQGQKRGSVAKVSHTLDVQLADQLEEFAFHQRFSESAVIEFALRQFFERGDDETLGQQLRESGAGRRRKV